MIRLVHHLRPRHRAERARDARKRRWRRSAIPMIDDASLRLFFGGAGRGSAARSALAYAARCWRAVVRHAGHVEDLESRWRRAAGRGVQAIGDIERREFRRRDVFLPVAHGFQRRKLRDPSRLVGNVAPPRYARRSPGRASYSAGFTSFGGLAFGSYPRRPHHASRTANARPGARSPVEARFRSWEATPRLTARGDISLDAADFRHARVGPLRRDRP